MEGLAAAEYCDYYLFRAQEGKIVRRSKRKSPHPDEEPNDKSFHEKAGVSQDGFVFTCVGCLPLSQAASVAILPSALFVERLFARCQLGVPVSAGAAT